MKILRIILVIGGLALLVYGILLSVLPQYRTITPEIENQRIGIFGLALLALLAGFFMRRRR